MKSKTTALILCIFLGYLGIHRFYTGKIKSGVLYLLTGGLCGIGWIVDIILICTDKFFTKQTANTVQTVPQTAQKNTTTPAPVPRPAPTPTPAPVPKSAPTTITAPIPAPAPTYTPAPVPNKSTPAPAPARQYVPMPSFPSVANEYGLKYEYENELCFINTTAAELNAKLGSEITFKQEPENEHDNQAVAVLQDNRKLGYIYRGQTQEMANRWLKEGSPLLGFISFVDNEQNKIKYKIGFYKPLAEMQKETFKLTGLRQKDGVGELREDNIRLFSVGDDITAEYDDVAEKYIVWCGGCEIGTLPKKAEEFAGGKEKIIGILTKVDFDDEDKCSAEVEMYK